MDEEKVRGFFYTTCGWMVLDLGLKGNALSVYSIIYGFSQDGESEYTGSYEFISQVTGLSKQTIINTINSLVEQGFIVRTEHEHQANSYRAVWGSQKILLVKNFDRVVKNFDYQPAPPAPPTLLKDSKSIKKPLSKDNVKDGLVYPFDSEAFRSVWDILVTQPEWKKKTVHALQLSLNKLGVYDEEFAILLMNEAIERGWRGVVFDNTPDRYASWKKSHQTGAKEYPDGTYRKENFTYDEMKEQFYDNFDMFQKVLRGYSVTRKNGKWYIND